MGLSFLPGEVLSGINHLNTNYLTEVRLREGQPVSVEYNGEYYYLTPYGISKKAESAIIVRDLQQIINAATNGCVYGYAEQMKGGFITVGHGIRIGLAGQYVTQNGEVISVKSITSLNIRVPHDIMGCAKGIYDKVLKQRLYSILIFSRPGLGKTTMLRDIARLISGNREKNVLVFDERGEIAAMDAFGNGFDLGTRVDVIRSGCKLAAIHGAIRALKPDVIITDELYGKADIEATRYCYDCNIPVIASTHITDHEKLKNMPFDYFAGLTKIGEEPEIYDKNFDIVCRGGVDNLRGCASVGREKEENADI